MTDFSDRLPSFSPVDEVPEKTLEAFFGSPQCVADFLDRHRDELSRFIVRKLGSEEHVSDFLQEAYVRLGTHSSDDAIQNPRAFVFRIVANLIIDFQRRNVNRLPHDNGDDVWQEMADQVPGPEQQYQHQQRLAAIHSALAELPWQCRQAFFLNRVEGRSHAEVANQLGISESMVAKHLVRAMTHCREKLKHY